jgi:hypothetical protein
LNTNDGAQILVDDDAVVSAEFSFAPRLTTGDVVLIAGIHKLNISYFHGRSNSIFEVLLKTPNVEKLSEIPVHSLYYKIDNRPSGRLDLREIGLISK